MKNDPKRISDAKYLRETTNKTSKIVKKMYFVKKEHLQISTTGAVALPYFPSIVCKKKLIEHTTNYCYKKPHYRQKNLDRDLI